MAAPHLQFQLHYGLWLPLIYRFHYVMICWWPLLTASIVLRFVVAAHLQITDWYFVCVQDYIGLHTDVRYTPDTTLYYSGH